VQRAACAGNRSAALRSFNIERFPQSDRNTAALGCADLPVIRVPAAFGRRHLRIRTLGRCCCERRAALCLLPTGARINAMLSSRLRDGVHFSIFRIERVQIISLKRTTPIDRDLVLLNVRGHTGTLPHRRSPGAMVNSPATRAPGHHGRRRSHGHRLRARIAWSPSLSPSLRAGLHGHRPYHPRRGAPPRPAAPAPRSAGAPLPAGRGEIFNAND
jgi:hypothetical protein